MYTSWKVNRFLQCLQHVMSDHQAGAGARRLKDDETREVIASHLSICKTAVVSAV